MAAYHFDHLDVDDWQHSLAYPYPRQQQQQLPAPAPAAAPAAYHPYPRYHQQTPQRRSPPHPLSQQQAYIVVPDDFVDTAPYAGQYDKMYRDYNRTRQPRYYDSPTYPSPPPPHPQLQHLQHVQIPLYPAGHGPRSASSSSSSSSHASASTSTSATSNASSYVPGPTDMMARPAVMCVPDLNLGMGIGGMEVDIDMGALTDMGMGMAMGMDMAYIQQQQAQQHQQPPPPPPQQQHQHQPSSISPQMVMHHHLQAQQQVPQHQPHILYDDEPSPMDGYAEYATSTGAGDADPYGLVDADHHHQQQLLQQQQQQHQQMQEMHQQQMEMEMQQQQQQQHLLGGAEVGVVQEWQREGAEYDSADSDSESDQQRAMVVGSVGAPEGPAAAARQRTRPRQADAPSSGKQATTAVAKSAPSESGSDSGSDSDESEAEVDQEDSLSYPPVSQNNPADVGSSELLDSGATGRATRGAAGTISKRSSTRTITPAKKTASGRGKGWARPRASTQTLTQRNVVGGDVDADVDAEGEDEVDEEVLDMDEDADASGEEDEEQPVQRQREEEDDYYDDEEMSEESSFDYDDEKDGEFVLRSTRSLRPSARSSLRRAAGDDGAARLGGGRNLRARKSGLHTTVTARYNPYSLYAANATAAATSPSDGMVMTMGSPTTATTHSSVIASSHPGLRTLSASLAIDTSFGSLDGSGFNSPSSPTLSTHSSALSHATMSSSSSSSSGMALLSGSKQRKPRPATNLPVPVPVPNLTKKSRGRRVPTVSSLEELRKVATTQDGFSSTTGRGSGRRSRGAAGAAGTTKGTRLYLCDVEGCGKCFARGEHLKRHVRSIHTNEKPHTCPYPGCGKDFSRHDNLGQHMRVHKDFVPPPCAKA